MSPTGPRVLHGNRGFHLELPDWVPAGSLGRLAMESGVGEGGLRPSLRAHGGGKEAIVGLEALAGEGEALQALEPLIGPVAEQIEPLLLRLDDGLAEPCLTAALAGQGWYRLRREDLGALQAWLEVSTTRERDALPLLAHAVLQHCRAHDLPRLEISEQRPGMLLEDAWAQIQAEAAQLQESRPSPNRRFVRGLLALFAGDARSAERELAASSVGGERRAERWLPIARKQALQQPRPDPHYQSAVRAPPSPELLAKLALERHVDPSIDKKPWRNRVLLLIVLLGAALLWLMDQRFSAAADALNEQTEALDEAP